MADQVYVTVENVKNPAVKRKMTVASAKINAKTWRIVGDQPTVEVKKKEDVKSVVKEIQKPSIQPVTEPIQEPSAFAQISDQVDEEQEEVEKLRAIYLEKSGKPADKRWKSDKLTSKIAEL
jgi:hypothetical protein